MSKPVEIEFLMKDRLSPGLDKASGSVDSLLAKAKEASAAINAKIAEQRKVIDGVSGDLERMQRQLQGMKPGTAQRELAADVAACRKVLAEERGALAELEKQHRTAEQSVRSLEEEYDSLKRSTGQAAEGQLSLAEKIAESKSLIKGTEADIKALEKAYKNAAPGNAKSTALAELEAAKTALQEEKNILASLTAEQERNRESGKRLSMQLREMQDAMAKMRLEGRQDTEEYRRMAAEAANLADTIADLRTQTNILSNDDANLQGFMSGVSGLSGAFTAATGAVSLFASENDNLAKVQARVQSVMAVTMGLQQVFNTLNKDSAFRLVTVVKMKNLLTTANTRLATSLGISTMAAQALMATLTLGLSAVITGLIVAFDRYSDAQEKAAEQAKERLEIEADGRAQMLKTRFELDTTRESLKKFTGTKEEEKRKCDELNRKYGESFGYYDTVAQWYDVLTKKADDYIQMLFLQAKAQALVNKAVEADNEVNKIKSQKPDEAESSMGWFQKSLMYMAQSESGGNFDAQKAIDEYNQTEYDKLLQAAESRRDALLDEAKALQQQVGEIGKSSGIGGHEKPDGKKTTDPQREHDQRLALEKRQAEELLALRRKNLHDEINLQEEGKEKKVAAIRQEYADRMAELEAQEVRWKEANKGILDAAQKDELERARKNASDKRDKDIQTTQREELETEARAMRDYLKEYGTYQQRKLAIAEEYTERIRKAQNEGERLSLAAERDRALGQAEINAVKQDIDWGSVFGEFGAMFKDQLQPTLDRLRKITESAEFKDSSVEDRQTVYALITKLEQSATVWDSDIFRKVSEDIEAYRSAMQSYIAAQERERAATDALAEAKKQLAKAEASGNAADTEAAKEAVRQAEENLSSAGEEVKTFGAQVQQTTTDLQESSQRAVGMFRELESGLKSLASGSLQGVGGGLMQLDKLFGGGKLTEKAGNALAKGFTKLLGEDSKAGKALTEALGSAGMAGQIISAVLGILDAIAQNGLSGILTGLQDIVLGAVEGILDDVLSGDILMKPLENVVGHVGNILNTLTFGGWNSWMGGNDKEVMETVDRLTESNKYLTESIDRLRERIGEQGNTAGQTLGYYKTAKEAEEEWRENQQGIIKGLAGAWTNHGYGFLGMGGKGSFNKHAPGSDWSGWETFRQTLKDFGYDNVTLRSAGDLWNLTPEQMALLRDNNPKEWAKLFSGDGHKNPLDAVNEYIEHAGDLDSLTEALNESLTKVSFDSLYSNFIDTLMDMDASAEDFAGNMEEYLMRAVLSDKVGELFKTRLDEWYKDFAGAMEDGMLSDEEIGRLRAEYDAIVKGAITERDNLANAIGYEGDGEKGKTQSGKAGSFNAMSQEQGTKLEGLFTSGQMHWASIDEKMGDVSEQMGAAADSLRRIEENTGNSAKHLADIKEDIRKMIRDGLKMK